MLGARVPLGRREGARCGNIVRGSEEGRELGGKRGDKHRETPSEQAEDGTLEVGVLTRGGQFAG